MTTPSSRSSLEVAEERDSPVEGTRPKIYFVWNYAGWGGAQIYFLAIMKAAVRAWDLRVLLPRSASDEIVKLIRGHGAEVEFLERSIVESAVTGILSKLQRQYARIRSEIEVFKKLVRLSSSECVIHLETAPWQSWILLSALCLRRHHVFVTLHNAVPRGSRLRETIWRLRWGIVSRLSDFRLFTANQDAKNSLKEWVSDEFWESIKVTYASIDPDQLSLVAKAEMDRKLALKKIGIPTDKEVVLCVGQFIDRKGRWIFLEAAEKTLKARNDIVFVWVMPDLPTDEDRKKISGFDLKNSFYMVRSRDLGGSRQDVLTFFRTASVFVLPSYLEGLPIALLEAMGLGIPSISTRINGIPEAVIQDQTGLLVSPGKSDELFEAICRVIDDTDLRLRLSEKSRRHVLENFDQGRTAEIVLNAYEAALN